ITGVRDADNTAGFYQYRHETTAGQPQADLRRIVISLDEPVRRYGKAGRAGCVCRVAGHESSEDRRQIRPGFLFEWDGRTLLDSLNLIPPIAIGAGRSVSAIGTGTTLWSLNT